MNDDVNVSELKLLIDIGNTRVKWQCSNMRTRVFVHGQSSVFLETDAWKQIQNPDVVYIVSVGMPTIGENIVRYAREHWGLTAHFLQTSETACGVRNGYVQPSQLGADRWMCLLGAWQRYRCPAFVVDVGSAVTIDLLGADGVHEGGWIFPGPTQMLEGLLAQTAKINQHADEVKDFWGRDTEHGVYNGVYFTVCAGINHLLKEAQKCLGYELLPIITGGGAKICLPLLDVDYEIEKDLVFLGMNFLVADV